ncbi:MAG: ferrous iron transport protein B, partial [Oscillospiraceae bacterium]|nr:ferrous iron transport protein B [Oscillospiraceae bacterium]
VPISASKGEGISELVAVLTRTVKNRQTPAKQDFCAGPVHRAIHAMSHLIEMQAEGAGYPVRFAATKLVEGDGPVAKDLALTESEEHILEHIVEEMEDALGTDREAALADMRYQYIEDAVKECVEKPGATRGQQRSDRIDKVLTHKYFGIPIFLGIMLLIFFLTFNVLGGPLQTLLGMGVDWTVSQLGALLAAAGVSPWLHSLVIDGICAGVGSVLSFLPLIVLLFFFLSLLEDSGYMARVAFVMDKLLRKIGLSGRSFVPMLIGFGCSVPAIMATRTLSSERDRKMTVLLTPFMSCSAKLPVYGMITAAFFPKSGGLVMFAVYCIGIMVAVLSGLLLKNTVFKGDSVPFVLELPSYRMPAAKSVILHMWEKAKEFLHKAFTIILAAALVIWFLRSFDWHFNFVEDGAVSILASIGSLLAPLFAPLGFADWRAATALLTGFTAKETVVSTLQVLCQTGGASLNTALSAIFTPLSAFSFLVFTVLYMPCVAAFGASKRELGSWRSAAATAAYQTGAAYLVSLVIFQLGSLLL